MTKRVAMISVHECPLASSEGKERGGINVYVYELSKALSRIGWQIDMYTRMQDTVNPAVVQVNDNARVIHVPAGPNSPIPKQEVIRHLDEFTANMLETIRSQHLSYDLIHAHYYYSGVVGEAVRKQLSPEPKLVMTFHTLGLLKQLMLPSGTSDDPKDRITLERRLVSLADKLVATSDNDATYLASLYMADNRHIATILPGVDTGLFTDMPMAIAKAQLNIPQEQRMILSVGRIDPVKGFDVLLYAIKLLVHQHPEITRNTCLFIVGGAIEEQPDTWNAEQKKLKALQKLLGLETTVTFVPAQSQKSLPTYYNAADVLVMPSHYESFGMVALEALACGTPVIATDVTGISPIVKSLPKGHVISANNPILLADQLAQVLSRRTKPSQRTRKVIQQFDWSETAKHMASVYTSLARG